MTTSMDASTSSGGGGAALVLFGLLLLGGCGAMLSGTDSSAPSTYSTVTSDTEACMDSTWDEVEEMATITGMPAGDREDLRSMCEEP